MQGRPARASTRTREAYFLDFARDVVASAKMPVMVTGGIRRRSTAASALAPEDGRPGVAMVGLAQALAYAPDLPSCWQKAELAVDVPVIRWKNHTLSGLATMVMTKVQLHRMGAGRDPAYKTWAPWALVRDQIGTRIRNRQYRNWLASRG